MTFALVIATAFAVGACKKEAKDAADPAKTTGDAGAAAQAGTTADPKAPAPSAAEGTSFVYKTPTAGDKSQSTETLNLKMSITTPDGQKMDIVAVQDEQKHVEVVEIAGEAETKVKVHYAVAKEGQELGGQKREAPSALQGKAYVVWTEGGTIKATTDKGGEVPADELALLQADWKDLGKVPPFATLVARRSWKVGERVDLTAEDLKILAESSEDMEIESGAIALASNDGKIATFDLDVKARREDKEAKLSMSLPLKMTAKVDATTVWPLELTMAGPFEATVQGMPATGTLDFKQTRTYP